MTNRQKWEQRILALDDEAFARLLNIAYQNEFGFALCDWCKVACLWRECKEGNCPDDLEYLAAEVSV